MKREGTAEPSPFFLKPAYNEFRRLSGTRVGVPLAAARRRALPVRLRRGVPLRRAALHTRRPGDAQSTPQPIQVRGVAGWHSRVVQVRTMAFTGQDLTGFTHGLPSTFRYAWGRWMAPGQGSLWLIGVPWLILTIYFDY